ncbi:MAG TPA: hydantoinase/oxoprolinase family protein [Blastocatellia bacterium]|nr:hydantoinase/oxoprolinase family protein [Blastocatellia bacterium]
MNLRKQTSALEKIRIGIDTGGTFTDFVVARGSRIDSFKIASTPHNPAEAILDGITRILTAADAAPSDIVHGTTVATNALLERKGARTALLTTAGFEDVIEIGRQNRPEIYNLMVTRPAPLVPRELRFGLTERIGPDGSVITGLGQSELATVIQKIAGIHPKVESVAVCFLFSFANPAHEREAGRALESLGTPVSLSHKILPEFREYERTATVVINAYLVPLMSKYLSSLAEGLDAVAGGRWPAAGGSVVSDQWSVASKKISKESRRKNLKPDRPLTTDHWPLTTALRPPATALRVMQSNGGSVSAATAAAEPVRAILSGPAGGVIGALRVCAAAGVRDIITFDMGGTSTDVALCRGEAHTTNEALVAGLPVAVPVIDIHTVGAGGGSIARVDAAGALRVGPESAGADPGPACYGRGEEVTVTDANLVLGRFGGSGLLGGEMKLDLDRANLALSRLAAEMSRFSAKKVSPQRAALGVVQVANANMERALRVVSIERGRDPRMFSLVSFGGAGGLHVCELAEALRIPRVVVPRSPGTLSALGVLLGDVVKDYSRTVMLKAAGLDLAAVERSYAALEKQALRDLGDEGFTARITKLVRSAAVRYAGQSFEIEVPFTGRLEASFHAAHLERYGYADKKRATEIVSLRVRGIGVTEKPQLRRTASRKTHAPEAKHLATVSLTGRASRVPVYSRDGLRTGASFEGPAVVSEYSSTTLVPSGWRVSVDPWLNLFINRSS